MAEINPANRVATEPAKRARIPMSVPMRRLEVPELAGYHLHWFVDRNVPRAQQAGYEFVASRDIPVNQHGVATSRTVSGNADLGSHISQIGGTAEGGGSEYLHLMKIREEWWLEDHKILEDRNASVMQAIFRDEQIAGADKHAPEDKGLTYVRSDTNVPLFQRKTRKGK